MRMKLLICIIDNYYVNYVEKQLRNTGYRMTELASTGGFLRKGSTTFFIGVEEEHVSSLQKIIKEACLDVEKVKGRKKSTGSRYTSFLINANQIAPFL